MNPGSKWVYHDPRWWIDTIATVCTPDLESHTDSRPVAGYFADVKVGYEGTLSYLSKHAELSPEDAARSLFFAKALKKWRLPLSDESAAEREQKAMVGFYERNRAVSRDGCIPECIECMKGLLSRWLPPPSLEAAELVHGRFGPGSVAEKMPHPQRFCRLWEWCQLGGRDFETLHEGHADVKAHVSRLCAVPKDWDKDRLITVEPVYSSFLQQRARSLMLESIHQGPLKGTCMDLGYTDGQAIQRRLALSASRTGRLATLDLSDASDSISWVAVQAAFPEWVVDLLWDSRSTQFESNLETSACKMDIFAGMGNATTFVVETLFFSAYVVAEMMVHGQKWPFVSTFGDDIIVPSEAAEMLLEEGDKPFFKINKTKSFLGAAALRESCGVFAHNGHDITVPKIDGYQQNWYGALGISDLHRRCANSPFIFLRKLGELIARVGVLENWPFLVDGYPSISEWSTEFSVLPPTRVNRDTQTREAQVRTLELPTVSYPCYDFGVDTEQDPDLLGLDTLELARKRTRELKPPADVWYCARQLGCLETDPFGIRRETDIKRASNSKVSFINPDEHPKERACWRTVFVDSTHAYESKAEVFKDFSLKERTRDKVLRATHFGLRIQRGPSAYPVTP